MNDTQKEEVSKIASQMGRLGGLATKKKHPNHFKDMVNKRWENYEKRKSETQS